MKSQTLHFVSCGKTESPVVFVLSHLFAFFSLCKSNGKASLLGDKQDLI